MNNTNPEHEDSSGTDQMSLRTIDLLAGSMSPLEIDYTRLDALKTLQAPTLFIGLGGGGTRGVSFLKKLFTNTFQGHLPPGAGEVPAGYQFLAFDSDQKARPGNMAVDTEWHHVGVNGLGFGEWDKLRTSPQFRDWIMTDIEEAGIMDGCKGFRNLGRLLAQLAGSRISKAIKQAETRARSYANLDQNQVLHVYLFCTLGGGTGSGMLLETTFMLRYLFRNLATIKINAMLACPEGFPQQDEEASQTTRAGVYSALREIDHFMTGSRRKEMIDELERERPPGYLGGEGNVGVYNIPNSDACGLYSRPFNLCFLFGHQNEGGTKLLTESSDMSAFMARMAFALTTYPASEDGQNFASNMDNVLGQHLNENNVKNGAGLYYMVPGIMSIHAPVAETFDIVTLQAATHLLRDMRTGGISNEETRVEAESLRQRTDTTLPALTEYLREKVERRYGPPNVHIKAADDALSGDRHSAASKKIVFRVFNETVGVEDPTKAVDELQKEVWSEVISEEERNERSSKDEPPTIEESLVNFKEQLLDACNQEMIQPKRRLAVVKDMLLDLKIILDEQLNDALANRNAAEAKYFSRKQSFENDRTKTNHFYGQLDNVTQDDGLLDKLMEIRLLGEVKRNYGATATQAYRTWFDFLLQPLLVTYIEDLIKIVDSIRADITQYEGACEHAEVEMNHYIKELERLLYQQEEGRGGTLEDTGYPVDTCFSLNIMNGSWRQKYTKVHNLAEATTVQTLILQHHSDWRPFDAIQRQRNIAENRTQAKLSTFISDDFCAVLKAHFDREYEAYSMWEGGAGLRRSMEFAMPSNSGKPPMQHWMEVLNSKCKPQWDTNLNQLKLGQLPLVMTMFAGPPSVTQAMAQAGNFAGGLNHSLSYESNRLTMLRFAYPIGLPGISSIHTPFRTTYNLKVKMEEDHQKAEGKNPTYRRSVSCYPDSWTWKDPAETYDDGEEFIGHFTSMMILNQIAESKVLASADKEIFAKALEAIADQRGGPRKKGLGLFIRGAEEFWMSPWFEINRDRNIIEDPEPLLLLGRGVEVAFRTYRSSQDLVDSGNQWDQWLDKNRSALLVEDDFKAIKKEVSDKLNDMLENAPPGEKAFSLLNRMLLTLR